MEQAIFGQALSEYLRFRRIWPWIFLGLFCLTLAALWNRLLTSATPLETYSSVSMILVFRIVALASAIFTTAIISQEVEQRTIVYLLTRPVERWKLLLIRYLASVIVVSLLGILAAGLTAIGAQSTTLLPNDAKAIILGAFAYGGLFLLVSLLFNRAMIICLLFAFGWETSVPNMPGDLYRMSIFSHLQAVAAHPADQGPRFVNFASGGMATNAISEGSGWVVLVVLILVTVCLSAWWFSNFEYVPREDAE